MTSRENILYEVSNVMWDVKVLQAQLLAQEQIWRSSRKTREKTF